MQSSTRKIVKRRTVKGYWDCSYCGTEHIDGLKDYCPNCGVHKPSYTKNKLDTANLVQVTKEELAEAGIVHSNNGEKRPEWICEYCNSFNNWLDDTCASCGSSRSESKRDYFSVNETEQIEEESIISESISFDEPVNDSIEEPVEKDKTIQSIHKSYNNFKLNFDTKVIVKYSIITLAVIIIGLFIFNLFKPYTITTTVNGFSWEYTINIEEERTVQDSGWSVPSGARVYDQREEIYTYESVISHYEEVEVEHTREVFSHYEYSYETEYIDNGDGTYDEVTYEIETPVYTTEIYYETEQHPVYIEVPVYETKYYYEIDRWFFDYSVQSYGTDKNTYWNTNYRLNNNQRDTDRMEVYTIYYDNGTSLNVNYSEWIDTELGDTVEITTCKLGIIYNQSNTY